MLSVAVARQSHGTTPSFASRVGSPFALLKSEPLHPHGAEMNASGSLAVGERVRVTTTLSTQGVEIKLDFVE